MRDTMPAFPDLDQHADIALANAMHFLRRFARFPDVQSMTIDRNVLTYRSGPTTKHPAHPRRIVTISVAVRVEEG